MHYYSMVVVSPDVLGVPEKLLTLDRGRNVFCIMLEDYDSFSKSLIGLGVQIVQATRLDDHERLTPEDMRISFPEHEDRNLLDAHLQETPSRFYGRDSPRLCEI